MEIKGESSCKKSFHIVPGGLPGWTAWGTLSVPGLSLISLEGYGYVKRRPDHQIGDDSMLGYYYQKVTASQ